jgi:hypothetical protein
MKDLFLVLVVVLLAGSVISFMRRRGRTYVAKRGFGVGADLGTLSDKPRVRVEAVTNAGPDQVRIVLRPEPGPGDGPELTAPDLDLVVHLREDEFGFELLHEWKRSESSIAIVIPPGSPLVRLRSVDDLQPLTLRQVDGT